MCIDQKMKLYIDGKETFIDQCIVDIVIGLNCEGVKTVASCCGHFNRWGSIVLADGRELIIAPDYESARAFDKLNPFNIHNEGRPLK